MKTVARRRVVRLLAAALGTSMLLGIGGVGAGTALAADPDPILLVHGYRGSPDTWAEMIARFAAEGRTAVAIDLPSEDNVVNATAIRDFLAARGWSRVDLVGQSMGGLSARQFVKFVKSKVMVDSYVSLGTPQYGIYSACVLPQGFGGQMCPNSSFLRALNRKDDTPGGSAWTTIYSTGDLYVPNSASRLDGGACHVQVAGVGHNEMDNDAGIFAHVLAAVDGACTGTFVR
ncbi:MAG TPA: alpha/beta fold hydrolase [Candidatus Limnocylindrales bacterium]|nr:alpha/beta fold hydrolase [Candidatus Limnocylindrales bacterium]